jgi:predicted peptidase
MTRRCFSLLLGCFSAMTAPLSAETPVPGALAKATATVKNDSGSTSTIGYWTYLPKAAKPAAGWPLLVFLHGSGERGSDLNLVKKHGPPKLAGQKPELESFLMLAPQCPSGRWWDTVAVKDLIDQTLAAQPIDRSRIYLTGISMGGYATWTLLKDHPEFMAAAVPICGAGDPTAVARFKTVPIWTFHGDQDPSVPVQRSIDMVEALKKEKGNIKFTLYEGVTHDCWTRTFDNPDLYSWLLEHRK